jgi:hypothetical protein
MEMSDTRERWRSLDRRSIHVTSGKLNLPAAPRRAASGFIRSIRSGWLRAGSWSGSLRLTTA